ncbi:conserved hypothetical protein [Thermobifida fusca YX]|nr:conserved hypothetical protein [Thermobifida fusca YX]
MGLTGMRKALAMPGPVHPHVRGAHIETLTAALNDFGPSPRAWGSPSTRGAEVRRWRSIPTCVGRTVRRHSRRSGSPVHPHVRGAHSR